MIDDQVTGRQIDTSQISFTVGLQVNLAKTSLVRNDDTRGDDESVFFGKLWNMAKKLLACQFWLGWWN